MDTIFIFAKKGELILRFAPLYVTTWQRDMLLDTYLSAHYKLWIVLKSHEYKIAVRYTVYSLSRCHAKTTYSTLRCYHYQRLNILRTCKRTL